MDKNKQPGINFIGIMLVQEKLWRDYNIPDELEISFDIEMTWDEQGGEYATELTSLLLLLYKEKPVLTLESKFVGLFSIEPEAENMNIEDFIKSHSAGLMFPYIREHISAITQKAGVHPVLLPPVNIMALLKKSEENN